MERSKTLTAPSTVSTNDASSEQFDALFAIPSPPGEPEKSLLERKPKDKKPRWNNILGKFVLISYVVGLGNVVSFPAMYLTNGRSFLIPMIISYLFIGIPMLLIEIIIGQFSSLSPHEIFGRITPLLSSIGGGMSMVIIWRSMYLVPFMAQGTYLAVLSTTSIVNREYSPWYNCTHMFKGEMPNCIELRELFRCKNVLNVNSNISFYNIQDDICRKLYYTLFILPSTPLLTPHLDWSIKHVFRDTYVTHLYHYVPGPVGVIVLLFVIWGLVGTICFFDVKLVGFFGTFCAITPFIIFIACFTFVSFHNNNSGYLSILIGADWEQLSKLKTWSDAVSYTLFSLSLADGGVIKIASHNSFNNNLLIDLLLAVSANILMSLITTATYIVSTAWISSVIHPINDYMSNIFLSGYEAYQLAGFPEFAASQVGGGLFVFMYYLNILILGLPSVCISLLIVVDAIYTRFNCKTKLHRLIICLLLFGTLSIVSIVLITPGGMYLMRLMLDDSMSATALIGLLEVIAFVFKYGLKNFSNDIESMLGYRSYIVRYSELVSWRFVTPISLLLAMIIRVYYTSVEVFILVYFVPEKMKIIGWSMLTIVLGVTILYFVVKIIILKCQGRSVFAVFGAHDNWRKDEDENVSDDEFFSDELQRLKSDELAKKLSTKPSLTDVTQKSSIIHD